MVGGAICAQSWGVLTMRFLLWWLGLVVHVVALAEHAYLSVAVCFLLWSSLAVWCVSGLVLLVAGVLRMMKGGAPKFTPPSFAGSSKQGEVSK